MFKHLDELKTRGILDDVTWYDKDGKPDFDLVIKGRTIVMKCKNVRSGTSPKKIGKNYRVEVQKTRNQLVGDQKLRGYPIDEFEILAVCLFNQTGQWKYLFVRSSQLERRVEHPDYLVIMQTVPPK